MNCMNVDGIKTEINKEIELNKSLLEAWEKVTFSTKKDGKPFANMAKNFEGAKYQPNQYSLQSAWCYELKITVCTRLSGYQTDVINCYEYLKYLKGENKKSKTENVCPKERMLEQIYKYDLEDIKQAIEERKKSLAEKIDSLNRQLANVEKVYNNFAEAYKKAIKQLEEDTNSRQDTALYYNVFDTITKRYPYC